MKKVTASNGKEIGLFNGITVKDANGRAIYWLSDDEVFAPMIYVGRDLSSLNKGQFNLIGKYMDNQCITSTGVIFTVQN